MNKFKFKKYHKIRLKGSFFEQKSLGLLYGDFGLRACNWVLLTETQIESMRRTAKKHLKKQGFFFLRVKADRSVSKKPGEVRMGKGKGNHSYSVSIVKKGSILIELGGDQITDKLANIVLGAIANKLPIKTEIIKYKS